MYVVLYNKSKEWTREPAGRMGKYKTHIQDEGTMRQRALWKVKNGPRPCKLLRVWSHCTAVDSKYAFQIKPTNIFIQISLFFKIRPRSANTKTTGSRPWFILKAVKSGYEIKCITTRRQQRKVCEKWLRVGNMMLFNKKVVPLIISTRCGCHVTPDWRIFLPSQTFCLFSTPQIYNLVRRRNF